MNNEDKFFRELLDLTKENNRILRSMNSQRKWGNFFWVFKWLLILAFSYTAYLALQPYIQSAMDTMQSINNLNAQANQMQTQMQNLDQKTLGDYLTKQLRRVVPE